MLYSYFVPVTSHKQEEWTETVKGIDNEVNSEKNKENVHALLSLIIDYKYKNMKINYLVVAEYF